MLKEARFVGLAGIAVAALLGYGSGMPDIGGLAANSASTSEFFSNPIALRDWNLHWPSVGFGIAAGILLTLVSQISWLELPRNVVRWLIANERNFYRLGIAGVCLAVLLFY